MSLLRPPRLVDDPAWERAYLGSFVARARRALAGQLRSGVARSDPRATLERAYRSVPFHQRSFARAAIGLRDLADPRALAALPITRREDLARGVEHFLAMPVEPDVLARGWLGRTSGSTGTPVAYLRDPRTHAWFWAFLDFAVAYAGRPRIPRGARIVLLDALAHMPEYDAHLPLLRGARYAKRSSARPDLARVLSELGPHVITGDPESLAPLAELDLPPRARPALILSSAFAMPPSVRDAIARATGAAVLEYYATQETSVIAIGCREGRGFHPLSGACVVEAVPAPHGGTELVVTPTHNPSFVLLRYAPGDLGTLEDGACACGLSGLRIASLDGRTHTSFEGVRGRFAAGVLTPLLARLPVVEHQVAQRARDRYVLRYRAREPLAQGALAPLRARLSDLAGTAVVLELEPHDEPLPRAGSKPEPFRVEVG